MCFQTHVGWLQGCGILASELIHPREGQRRGKVEFIQDTHTHTSLGLLGYGPRPNLQIWGEEKKKRECERWEFTSLLNLASFSHTNTFKQDHVCFRNFHFFPQTLHQCNVEKLVLNFSGCFKMENNKLTWGMRVPHKTNTHTHTPSIEIVWLLACISTVFVSSLPTLKSHPFLLFLP